MIFIIYVFIEMSLIYLWVILWNLSVHVSIKLNSFRINLF